METKAQVPNYLNPYTPASDTLPMPAPERESAPLDKVSVEKTKSSALDKYNTVAGAIGKATQEGLSYANARRARETYKPIKFDKVEE